jgi:hypothetical protein
VLAGQALAERSEPAARIFGHEAQATVARPTCG